MKVAVLASGSKGNCTYLKTKNHNILIDMGMTTKYIENELIELGVLPSSIDIIFITHDHNDHINALKTFIKKHKTKVYLTSKLNEFLNLDNYSYLENKNQIDSLLVEVIKTSHDASDSVGFIFEEDDTSLVYITDTGYINVKYKDLLTNKNMYIIESNHDIETLMNGRYRYDLKMRILSDKGHLSNESTADYLSEYVGTKTSKIILAHLSEENNREEIAYKTVSSKVNKEILIAKQNKRTDLMDV